MTKQTQLKNIITVTDPDGKETVIELYSYDIKAVVDFLDRKGYSALETVPVN